MPPEIKAGTYPPELLAACAAQGVEPGELWAWSVSSKEVRLLMPSGAKYVYLLRGAWSKPKAEPAKPAKGQKE